MGKDMKTEVRRTMGSKLRGCLTWLLITARSGRKPTFLPTYSNHEMVKMHRVVLRGNAAAAYVCRPK